MEHQKIKTAPKLSTIPQKTEITFWSRTDPVRVFEGRTNHWTLLRVCANLQSESKIDENVQATVVAAAAKRALKALRPIGAALSKKGTTTRHRLDPKKLENNYYLQAKKNYMYWHYDPNDPFTYRSRGK